MLNQKRMAVLKKVIDKGYADDKAIISITAEQMTTFCRSISEITDVIELQKAVKTGHLIAYLANKDKGDKLE
ncbi:MAG: hypothetical protein ACI4N4_02065 [Candidatus Fimenecus sp.]